MSAAPLRTLWTAAGASPSGWALAADGLWFTMQHPRLALDTVNNMHSIPPRRSAPMS